MSAADRTAADAIATPTTAPHIDTISDSANERQNDGRAGCAERGAHGQLAAPSRHAREQHVREVRAGHDEQQPDGRHQQQQHRTDTADQLVLQRKHRRVRHQRVWAVSLFESFRDRRRLGTGGGEADAVPQARHNLPIVTGTKWIAASRLARRPHVDVRRERESRRHDPSDGVRFAIDATSSGPEIRQIAKMIAPEAIADNRGIRPPFATLVGRKPAAMCGVSGEHVEEAARDLGQPGTQRQVAHHHRCRAHIELGQYKRRTLIRTWLVPISRTESLRMTAARKVANFN
jgi:hypothetical protein